MFEWVNWALLEGVFMGFAKFGHGMVGSMSPTLFHVLFATAFVGIVQTMFGYIVLKARGVKLEEYRGPYRVNALVFGVCALAATICAFAAFRMGSRADMAANTFISSTLAIAPLAVLGRILFQERLGTKQWIGIGVAISGVYVTLVPSFGGDGIPVWVWWSAGTMIFSAATETVSRWQAQWERNNRKPKLDPLVLQFWGGLGMAVPALLAFIFGGWFFEAPEVIADILTSALLLIYALAVAGCNIAWWWFRLRAFQKEAPLCFKKFPSVFAYLVVATAGGILLFHDPLSWTKLGIFLFAPAFLLGQKGAWEYGMSVSKRFFPATALQRPSEEQQRGEIAVLIK